MKNILIPIDGYLATNRFSYQILKVITFYEEVKEIRELSKELPYDFWVVLVGDMITEEALPTYESWLMDVEGVGQVERNSWSKWVRHWTAEENRHGDVLNKYLYLSGRVNMKEIEKTTQYLIADGFDIGTDRDPYKNFVYTSFQEFALIFRTIEWQKSPKKKAISNWQKCVKSFRVMKCVTTMPMQNL